MLNLTFRKRLEFRQRLHASVLCIGLDPKVDKMPAHLRTPTPKGDDGLQIALDVIKWMKEIVEVTYQFACMYKPQRAHFEALGKYGQFALEQVITFIKENYGDVPIFLDCKRGDIDATQEMYRIAQFDYDGAEGMNFSPYMGKSCMEGLVDPKHPGRAIVGLCYTSNPSARKVQDVKLENGRPYWEFIAEEQLQWAQELNIVENAGLVMAAAYEFPKGSGQIYSQHLSRCREIVGDQLWFLIPGVGKQGGAIRETILASYAGWGSIAINSSSDIIFAGSDSNYLDKVREKACETFDTMYEALTKVAIKK